MSKNRLRSIVPMFGGGTRYVETLEEILKFVETTRPNSDELVNWHRENFQNVSSKDSIMRRVRYLEQVGFLAKADSRWELGPEGRRFNRRRDVETLLQIMCTRNVGLRSLLYALSVEPMTISEVSRQQLDTHPELGWSPGQTDMAKQRVNWLRSMGLVQKQGDEYRLTDRGRHFVEEAVKEWANSEWTASGANDSSSVGTYETQVNARAVDPEFRATVLSRHDSTCPISGVDHPGLLDVAHILPWSDYPKYRAELTNVVPLSKTHHAAFDRGLFTLDREFRLRVNPTFETQSELLQQTILDRAGERLSLDERDLNPEFIARHNRSLEWV